MSTACALIDVASQNGATAGQDLANIFKNHWPDPSLVLGYELNPMRSKDGSNMISNMGAGRIIVVTQNESDLPTVYRFAFFEGIQSV